MALITADQYRESIKDNRVVYQDGKRVTDLASHPIQGKIVDLTANDYVMALDHRWHDLLTEELPSGEKVHFTFMVPKTKDDLIRRRKIIQAGMHVLGIPGAAKFTGIDGLNGLNLALAKIDRKRGTNYSERLAKYRRYLMDIDSATAIAMTDVKGNRSLHPQKQIDHQDYYLRIVDRLSDGIVVRGAKSHISYVTTSNEVLVMPSRAMSKGDDDYAVAFAIPVATEGLKMIASSGDGIGSVVIFDDVFVPNDRIFLAGEWEDAFELPYGFSAYHRLSSDTYKYASLEVLVGCAALMAEYNGLQKTAHVRDKLAWLVMYCEATEALGKMAVEECEYDESGIPYPNALYSNIAKFFFASNYYTAEQHLQDIAGGLVSTLPSLKDLQNPETGEYLKKYLGTGVANAEERMRAFRLVQSLTLPNRGNGTIHAEGSLAAQRTVLYAFADWDRYKAYAKHAAGIPCDHPLVRDLPSDMRARKL